MHTYTYMVGYTYRYPSIIFRSQVYEQVVINLFFTMKNLPISSPLKGT